jgi:hypothetical protein
MHILTLSGISADRQLRAAYRVPRAELLEHLENDSSGGIENMNTGLKNKLLIMATAAGLAGFGIGCSSSEAPAAEEGAIEPTTGGEGDMTAPPPEGETTETPAPEGEAAPAEEAPGSEG